MKRNTSPAKEQIVFSVHYESLNSYPESISKGVLDYLILPENNDDQTVLSSAFNLFPKCDYSIVRNYLNFPVYRVYIEKNISMLSVDFRAQINKKVLPSYRKNPAELYEVNAEEEVTFFQYLHNTELTEIPSGHSFLKLKQNSKEAAIDFILRICNEIHNYISYQPNSTNITTTASDSLFLKAGVCQDFSHILIGICRSRKMLCRYVSGYFFTTHDVAQLHAWVEIYFREIGWIGFDPANHALVNENYIKIAHGVDFSDCSSVKGLISTKGINYTEYSVRINEIEQHQIQTQSQ